MLRGLLLTLLFMACVMLPPSAEALEPDPAGDPFEAGPAAPPPPPPPVDFEAPGSRRRAGPCRHGRGSGHHSSPYRQFGRDYSFGPGRHGGPPGYNRGFGPEHGRFGRDFTSGPGRHGGPPGYSRGFGPGQGSFVGGRSSHPGRMLFSERARRQLGLSEEQSSRLRQLGLEARKSAIRRRADMETKQLELEELLGAAEPDRAAIDRTVQEIGALHAARMKVGIDQRLNFQDVLTPEQREKMRELREQGFRGRRSGREAGKWKHGDRPGRPPWAPSEPDPPPSPPEQ